VPGIRQIGGALSVAYAQHWDNMAMMMMIFFIPLHKL
jgi:hypothetical protein